MALVRRPDPARPAADQASREIVLWTTRDGRELPLDDMSDDHIANAIRALSLWRSRLKKRGGGDPILRDLATAITRFKLIQRRRRKAAGSSTRPSDGTPSQSSSKPRSRLSAAPRKPVAST